MAFEIVVRNDHGDPRLDEVRGMLRAHNLERNPEFMTSEAVPLSVVGLTEAGEVVGGLIGQTRGRWLRVDIMAVRRDLRRRGFGRHILNAAESEARARGCEQVFLDTLDYQGPQFYEACGYARRCELPDWDSYGHAKLIYVKVL